MALRNPTPQLLELIASRFKALAEPARLQILTTLGDGDLTVSDLVSRTGLGQANVSKHLHLLHALGFVRRRREGLFVYYGLADRDVLKLCDIMCGRMETQTQERRKVLATRR